MPFYIRCHNQLCITLLARMTAIAQMVFYTSNGLTVFTFTTLIKNLVLLALFLEISEATWYCINCTFSRKLSSGVTPVRMNFCLINKEKNVYLINNIFLIMHETENEVDIYLQDSSKPATKQHKKQGIKQEISWLNI